MISLKAGDGFGWGTEGDGVIEMTGTFTRNAVSGVEGIWMRPSTQVVTLRFRRAPIPSNPGADSASPTDNNATQGTAVAGTLDWPEEQASAEFHGRVCLSAVPSEASSAVADAVLTLEGKVGQVLQGAPERVGWVSGATIRGTFCKDGTDGTLKGSWTANAPATAVEPLGPGGIRLNVGLLPDRLVAADGAGPGEGRSPAPGEGPMPGSRIEPIMGSSCRCALLRTRVGVACREFLSWDHGLNMMCWRFFSWTLGGFRMLEVFNAGCSFGVTIVQDQTLCARL